MVEIFKNLHHRGRGGAQRKCHRGRQLQLLVKLAGGARDEDPARDIALAVLHPLHNAGRLAALGAIGALGRVHDLLAVGCLGDLCWHGSPSSLRHNSGFFVSNLN